MLVRVKEKLARFRSELHMSRYAKALKQGQNLIAMLKEIDECKLRADNQTLISDIRQEMELAAALHKLITEGGNEKKLSTPAQKEIISQTITGTSPQNPSKWSKPPKTDKIGKWSKKTATNSSPQKQPFTFTSTNSSSSSSSSLFYSSSSVSNPSLHIQSCPQQSPHQNEQPIRLSEDQQEIVQRDVILPINIPEFFKREPNRVVVCYYEKCRSLIKVLREQISMKKQVIELEEISQWTASPKHQSLHIYVAPFAQNQQQKIRQILLQQKNLLILYSDIDRQLLTVSQSTLKNESFILKF